MFDKIYDFILFKNKCPLCSGLLRPEMRSAVMYSYFYKSSIQNINSDISSRLTGDDFVFKIKYTSANVSIAEKCSLNINTNTLSIDSNADKGNVRDIFNSFIVRFELHCTNKECKHNYYTFTNPVILSEQMKIENISTASEGFNLPKLWIQNDFSKDRTYIWSKQSENSPIIMPLIKIDPTNKDKMFNKIHTMVNFG